MNVKWMRSIDSKLGSLACSAMAVERRFGVLNRRPRGEVRKIAVMKMFGLGSIVVASPALAALRELYPNAEIHFVSFKSNREVLEILGLTDRNWFIDSSNPKAFVESTLRVAWELRREEIDLAVDLEFFAKFPLVLSGLAGIPQRAGFYFSGEGWRQELLDFHGTYNHYFHTRDIFLSLVYLLKTRDIYYTDFDAFRAQYNYPRHLPTMAELQSVNEKLRRAGFKSGRHKLIAINTNTSPDLAPEVRKWPEERYAELANSLLAENPDHFVVFIGAKSDRAEVSRIAARVQGNRVWNSAGELPLRELLALFSKAELFISNDSGPMHLACLVDVPVVGLFFADTPTLFAPIASRTATVAPGLYSLPLFHVYNGKDVVAARPMDVIENVPARQVPVARVLDAAREVMARPTSSRRASNG